MRTATFALLLAVSTIAGAQSKTNNKQPAAKPDSSKFTTGLLSGLQLRSIGPALTSGRVSDIAIDPGDKRTWYVAAASGGVWKSTNGGISFSPIFDGQGSFSIGTINIDHANPSVIWVGTGENNAQRVVSYGDGIYKSIDGGRSWKNMGLKQSEHIGRVVIDPRNPDVVYVAAQGPLWKKGGDRGVYKTTDGGQTWTKILGVDDWTGANDIQLDPRNPDILIATTWQRERRVYAFVAGGPGSAVWRSTDAGKTWTKSQSGFPDVELGRIGLAVSPANPSVVYAIAEAAEGKGGFFRSRDGGASWDKMSGYQSGSNYYNEIFADPKDVDRVYAIEPILQVTDDGGKTFHRVGERNKHVDNHVVWIDPDETTHLIIGCDGGVYESFDGGKSYRYVANLPITQYYRVATDESKPFYRVFGGAQDNFSIGGPSRTRNVSGITNADWFITSGGDGFGSVVDPVEPNTVYAESQFGSLSRFNLKTGDVMGIQPTEEPGTPGPRWGWDSPLFISPFNHNRLYFASNRLFMSNDRGDTWKVISPDLSRLIDRNRLKVMDHVMGLGAVSKNASTTLFGVVLTIAESPVKEGLLFAGTDDGKISVSENNGGTWRSIDHVPGVADTAPVFKILPSQHGANVVYAAFNNHQAGDFKPYVMKSSDLGRTWTSIAGDLPQKGSVYALAEDHVNRDLLFAGTEYGLFVTRDGGRKWLQLNGGLPTIQVRDLAIQKRENDLVVATFGRGFYVLDDYSALRTMGDAALASSFVLFPSRPAPLYVPSVPLGLSDAIGPAFQGAGYYMANNPPLGAVFTYYMKTALKSRRDARQAAEKELAKKGSDVFYPAWDSLKAEDREEGPAVLVTISDEAGNPIRRFTAPSASGINRVAWDLQLQAPNPVIAPVYAPDPDWPFNGPPASPYVVPGTYQVSFSTRVNGVFAPLGETQRFQVVAVDGTAGRTMATLADQQRIADLERSVLGLDQVVREALGRMTLFKRAIDETPTADASLQRRVRVVTDKLKDAQEALNGDPTLATRNEATPLSLLNRLNGAIGSDWGTTLEAPNAGQRAELDLVRSNFGAILSQVRQLIDGDVKGLEQAAEQAGVPWTSGRFPSPPRS
ncbi:MAG: glycosyl hydrolase [Gemmatimonadaceae bacterium]